MAGEKKTPAPIDRPLSRAYLREFSGWSAEYPPGLSDPTSLRIMENVMVNRDGSLRVRPGLRYLSYETAPNDTDPGVGLEHQVVGTHEVFFLNDGSKAYLFAVREDDDTVGFRVLRFTSNITTVHGLTDVGIDFDIPQGEAALHFSEATTYVKYLQIDNKIFALSNAGEPMRLFGVGEAKTARRMSSIERPDWAVDDKLTVMHPDKTWILQGAISSYRVNYVANPTFKSNLSYWYTDLPGGERTSLFRSTVSRDTGHSLKLESTPERTNLMTSPGVSLPATLPAAGEWDSVSGDSVSVVGSYFRFHTGSGKSGDRVYARSPLLTQGVVAGHDYRVYCSFGADTSNIGNRRILVRFYNSSNAQVGSDTHYFVSSSASSYSNVHRAPSGATRMKVHVGADVTSNSSGYLDFKNVLVLDREESTSSLVFDGNSGPDYFWTGTPHASTSVYHPPADVQAHCRSSSAAPGDDRTASIYLYSEAVGLEPEVVLAWRNSSSTVLAEEGVSAPAVLPTSAWTRYVASDVGPSGAASSFFKVRVPGMARGEAIYLDQAMLEDRATVGDYFDGDTPDTLDTEYKTIAFGLTPAYAEVIYDENTSQPTPQTPGADTLISSGDNDYNYGFFYTFSNEVGESAASMTSVIQAKRGWSMWKWNLPDGSTGAPTGAKTQDPNRAADQLVASMPENVFDYAIAQGATGWKLYMLTWSNQDSVPVTGVLVAERELDESSTYARHGWAKVTPLTSEIGDEQVVPSQSTRFNYTTPSSASQGAVVSDRMVLVRDPLDAAVIRWSSNNQGDYTNFTAHKGGGYKTLTSGNLFVPSAVKLWQNPQSTDTIVILCEGVDGHSVSYYMAPARVQSQSDTVAIMGFEETTATAGTSSPYGVEIVNNTLYHPIDEALVKSTASNYNINHKTMTDQIETLWNSLQFKDKIISSQLDNRIYYIVQNAYGEAVGEGMNGNEIWIFDTAAENGHWSRFLIQAHSLRKIEQGGRVYMSVVRPEGLYYLDPEYDRDDVVDPSTREVGTEFIPWRAETNTQGANRAHDAWAHLHQLEVNLGNFLGTVRWGLRSWDRYGQAVEISKVLRDLNPASTLDQPWDLQDQLRVARDVKEWFFYAESVTEQELDGEGAVISETVLHSSGQVNSVQYRYTPVSVNVGYEHGSVETFEYGRATENWSQRTTDAGVPTPFIDTRRP